MEPIYYTVEQLIENLNNFSPTAKVALRNSQTLEVFQIDGTHHESDEQVFIKFGLTKFIKLGDALKIGEPTTIGEPINNTNSEA